MSERVTALVRIIIYRKHKRAFLTRPYGRGIRENKMLQIIFSVVSRIRRPAGAHTQSAETFRYARTHSCSPEREAFYGELAERTRDI